MALTLTIVRSRTRDCGSHRIRGLTIRQRCADRNGRIGKLIHQIQRRVEKDVAIVWVCHHCFERSIARHNDSDRTLNHTASIEVGEILLFSEWLELLRDIGPDFFAIIFEVDEQDQRLRRLCIEHAAGRKVTRGMKGCEGILGAEYFEEWVEVK